MNIIFKDHNTFHLGIKTRVQTGLKTIPFKILEPWIMNQLEVGELPAEILFCTGTTLINNTLEDILNKFKRKVRKIIILGPSAGMLPDILFDYGIDIIGGMRIKNSDATLKVIQEGGGTRLFKQYGEKYNLMKE